MIKKILISLISFFVYSHAYAKTAEDILMSNISAEEMGRAIYEEVDIRDYGFGDMVVEIDMILRNNHGQEITKTHRNMTLEVQDMSVGDKTLIIFDKPKDVKGTAFLTFTKILEPDDQWLYLPALKRVKRISSKNKSGPFVGSEFAYEDISSQELDKYTYKYINNEACGNIECFVIERYPTYEHSGYTKQITWIDTQKFIPIKIEFYDRKDALLKTMEFIDYNQYLDRYWRANKFTMINHQNGKSTDIIWKNYKFQVGLKNSDFTKANLKRLK